MFPSFNRVYIYTVYVYMYAFLERKKIYMKE